MLLTQKAHSITGMSQRKYPKFDPGVAQGGLRRQGRRPSNKFLPHSVPSINKIY